MEPIPVLFTEKRSTYLQKPWADCYNVKRDARTYKGSGPVIAHPPCRLWGRLRTFSTADPREKELAVWAVEQVLAKGGILEHPAGSTLWEHWNLPKPNKGSTSDSVFSISVDQSWFGHPCKKDTWLLISGTTAAHLPPITLSFSPVTHVMETSKNTPYLPPLPKSLRSHTPSLLCDYLAEVIAVIRAAKA